MSCLGLPRKLIDEQKSQRLLGAAKPDQASPFNPSRSILAQRFRSDTGDRTQMLAPAEQGQPLDGTKHTKNTALIGLQPW